jgi:hypothetical protein
MERVPDPSTLFPSSERGVSASLSKPKMTTSAIKIQAVWRGFCARKGRTLPCIWCARPLALSPPEEGSHRWTLRARFGDPRHTFTSQSPCAACAEDQMRSQREYEQEQAKKTSAAVKIQAAWRGHRSREWEIADCCHCGHPMALSRSGKNVKLLYCGFPRTEPFETLNVWAISSGKFPSDCIKAISLKPCSWCEELRCYECGSLNCDGGRGCERYISCCICGGNCADGDYESWGFCTRRCMVSAGRDSF